MIYLIDDKEGRQIDFGWNLERFEEYKDLLTPIHSYREITDNNLSGEIFNEGNVVLFHESFFDNELNIHVDDSLTIRKRLTSYAERNSEFTVVFFSGSVLKRQIDNNQVWIPVSVLYNNLDVFLRKTREGEGDLRYLVYGKNPNLESELLHSLNNLHESWSEHADPEVTKHVLFFKGGTDPRYFFKENITYTTLIVPRTSDLDNYLHQKVILELSKKRYDSIFIPLCFDVLADFNGLRLAAHIRCTDTVNRGAPIFIYGTVGIELLLDHDCFNILKTKNVKLLTYSYEAFAEEFNTSGGHLTDAEVRAEIGKLHLKVPANYLDSHSIANEWAIYRWAKTIGCDDDWVISKLQEKVKYDLYFKYLRSLFPIPEIIATAPHELKIKNGSGKNVLYIDDDADKGWYEVICKLLYDLNGIDFKYLGQDDLRGKTKEEIVQNCTSKIIDEGVDLVILDLRLHPDDFRVDILEDITGIQVLSRVKKYNRGIQVIFFSATTKSWNLEYLRKNGADGFILKEGPTSLPLNITSKDSIHNFVKLVDTRLKLSFLKRFYDNYKKVYEELVRRTKKQDGSRLDKKFVNEVLKWLKLSDDILSVENVDEVCIVSSFLFKFSVLENIANRIIDSDTPYPIELSNSKNGDKLVKYQFRRTSEYIKYFKENSNGEYVKSDNDYAGKKAIPWHIKILNTMDFIGGKSSVNSKQLSNLVKKRNNVVHANATTGDSVDISYDDLIFLDDLVIDGLLKIV